MKDWYNGKRHELIRVAVSSCGFQVDYDPSRGMYRVSVFDEFGHWQDECWFDQYERPFVPGKAVSREWLLKDLSDWQAQLGVYVGDDPVIIAEYETVREAIEQFKINVQNAPDCEEQFNGIFYVGKKREDAPPEPTISAEKMREMCKNAKKLMRKEPEIVHCQDCCHRGTTNCPMYSEEWYEIDEGGGYYDSDFAIHDNTIDEGFCDRGEPMEEYDE